MATTGLGQTKPRFQQGAEQDADERGTPRYTADYVHNDGGQGDDYDNTRMGSGRGTGRSESAFGQDERRKRPVQGWASVTASMGIQTMQSGNGEAQQIAAMLGQYIRSNGNATGSKIHLMAFALQGDHNGVPDNQTIAILAAVNPLSGTTMYTIIFPKSAQAYYQQIRYGNDSSCRDSHEARVHVSTPFGNLMFQSIGRDMPTYMEQLSTTIATEVRRQLDIAKQGDAEVIATPVGVYYFQATGNAKELTPSDVETFTAWDTIVRNAVANRELAEGRVLPSFTYSNLPASDRRLTVTLQTGTPSIVDPSGIVRMANLRAVITAGGNARFQEGDEANNTTLMGTLHFRCTLVANSPGERGDKGWRPLVAMATLVGVETTIPAPGHVQMLMGATLDAFERTQSADVFRACIPTPADRKWRDIRSLTNVPGLGTDGHEIDPDALTEDRALVFIRAVTSSNIIMRVDVDFASSMPALFLDLLHAAWGPTDVQKEATRRVYGGLMSVFGIKDIKDAPAVIVNDHGVEYEGYFETSQGPRSLAELDMLAVYTVDPTDTFGADTMGYLNSQLTESIQYMLGQHYNHIQKQAPSAKIISIGMGLELLDEFMDYLIGMIADAGFTVSVNSSGNRVGEGRAPHRRLGSFGDGRARHNRRGGNGHGGFFS